jgi:type IV pilus assembly protein PilV
VTKEPAHEPPQPGPPALVAGGFSLIEVMIAMLVLAFGLLGFALLQTMNVRFVQSANYRTQATNLANDLIELMRAQRTDTLAGGATLGLVLGRLGEAQRRLRLADRRRRDAEDERGALAMPGRAALGEKASAQVTFVRDTGQVTVAISWGDQRWDRRIPTATTFGLTTFL